MLSLEFRGAGDRTRTDDILLGKQTLYQLSYTRTFRFVNRSIEEVHVHLQVFFDIEAQSKIRLELLPDLRLGKSLRNNR